jgi:hypothetical protein
LTALELKSAAKVDLFMVLKDQNQEPLQPPLLNQPLLLPLSRRYNHAT